MFMYLRTTVPYFLMIYSCCYSDSRSAKNCIACCLLFGIVLEYFWGPSWVVSPCFEKLLWSLIKKNILGIFLLGAFWDAFGPFWVMFFE